MCLNDNVISGKCWRCDELKAQLRDLEEKLGAVEKEAQNWSDSRTGWACRADILRILKGASDD